VERIFPSECRGNLRSQTKGHAQVPAGVHYQSRNEDHRQQIDDIGIGVKTQNTSKDEEPTPIRPLGNSDWPALREERIVTIGRSLANGTGDVMPRSAVYTLADPIHQGGHATRAGGAHSHALGRAAWPNLCRATSRAAISASAHRQRRRPRSSTSSTGSKRSELIESLRFIPDRWPGSGRSR